MKRRTVHMFWCTDDASTHKLTIQHFDPHYPSTQQTICCDNLPLWHSYTCLIRPGIFCPPQVGGGQFVTCNIMSTLFKMLCDIMSTLLWDKMWMLFVTCHLGTCGVIWACLAWGGQDIKVVLKSISYHSFHLEMSSYSTLTEWRMLEWQVLLPNNKKFAQYCRSRNSSVIKYCTVHWYCT